MALIDLRDVTKSYRRDQIEIPVLDGVTITVDGGDFLGLMGPSGSGKSTLLNLLAGIDRPTRGSIRIGEVEISRLSERALAGWRARHIGFIFQLYNLIPVLTAFENVELPLLLTSLSKKQRRDHVMTALGIVGLGDREKHYPRQLSGGQEQRVAIARDRHVPHAAAGGRANGRSGREVGRRGADAAAAAEPGIQEDDRHGDARPARRGARHTRAPSRKGHARRGPATGWLGSSGSREPC